MDRDELKRLAAAFRVAIERCDRRVLGVAFEYFPRGACGDASLILAEHLRRHGAGDVRYASGVRWRGEDRRSHAWLRVDGYIVDITADQFEEIDDPVIVTTDPAWHATFLEDEHKPSTGDYRTWDDRTAHEMAGLFAIVQREIPK